MRIWKKCATHRVILTWHPAVTRLGLHLFPDVKKHLRRYRFSTDDELKYATEEWTVKSSELFDFTAIEKLRDRYQICIDKGGEYVEKINVCSFVYLLSK